MKHGTYNSEKNIMTSSTLTEIKMTTKSSKTVQSIEAVKDIEEKTENYNERKKRKVPHFKKITKILIVANWQGRNVSE